MADSDIVSTKGSQTRKIVIQASVVLNRTIVRHNVLTNQLIIYVVVLVNACQSSRDAIGLMKVTNVTTHIKNDSHCQQ